LTFLNIKLLEGQAENLNNSSKGQMNFDLILREAATGQQIIIACLI
jgi:hypothetical protein